MSFISARRTGRRVSRRFTRRDLAVLGVLLGIPVLLDIAIVWGPTLASVMLSFTSWDGIGDIKWVGTQNYANLFTNYPQFWPAARHNLLWLAFLGLVAAPFGLLLAVLIDRGVRFSRFYQSTLYMPVVLSLAVVGFIAQLIFSRDQEPSTRSSGTRVRRPTGSVIRTSTSGWSCWPRPGGTPAT